MKKITWITALVLGAQLTASSVYAKTPANTLLIAD